MNNKIKISWAEIISLPTTNSIEEWIPKEGEYVIMEKAGGWGYSPKEQIKEHYNETINSSTNVEYSTKGALPLYNVKKRLVLN